MGENVERTTQSTAMATEGGRALPADEGGGAPVAVAPSEPAKFQHLLAFRRVWVEIVNMLPGISAKDVAEMPHLWMVAATIVAIGNAEFVHDVESARKAQLPPEICPVLLLASSGQVEEARRLYRLDLERDVARQVPDPQIYGTLEEWEDLFSGLGRGTEWRMEPHSKNARNAAISHGIAFQRECKSWFHEDLAPHWRHRHRGAAWKIRHPMMPELHVRNVSNGHRLRVAQSLLRMVPLGGLSDCVLLYRAALKGRAPKRMLRTFLRAHRLGLFQMEFPVEDSFLRYLDIFEDAELITDLVRAGCCAISTKYLFGSVFDACADNAADIARMLTYWSGLYKGTPNGGQRLLNRAALTHHPGTLRVALRFLRDQRYPFCGKDLLFVLARGRLYPSMLVALEEGVRDRGGGGFGRGTTLQELAYQFSSKASDEGTREVILDVVERLLQTGAEPDETGSDDKATPFRHAMRHENRAPGLYELFLRFRPAGYGEPSPERSEWALRLPHPDAPSPDLIFGGRGEEGNPPDEPDWGNESPTDMLCTAEELKEHAPLRRQALGFDPPEMYRPPRGRARRRARDSDPGAGSPPPAKRARR